MVFLLGERYYNEAFLKENDGLSEEAQGHFQHALTVWEKVIEDLPEMPSITPWAWNFAAECYRRLGEYEAAVGYYQEVVYRWPDYKYAWNAQFLIGYTYEQMAHAGIVPQSIANIQTRAAYEQLLQEYPNCKAASAADNWLDYHNK